MRNELVDRNPVLKSSIEFSLALIDYVTLLEENRKYVIARQLLRAGTAIGANIMEAQNAESKADFIHKMKIAAKEADETQYWLLLCAYSINFPDTGMLSTRLESITKMLNSIISTSKKTLATQRIHN
jgi:four helix bundle protein